METSPLLCLQSKGQRQGTGDSRQGLHRSAWHGQAKRGGEASVGPIVSAAVPHHEQEKLGAAAGMTREESLDVGGSGGVCCSLGFM